MSQGYTKGIPIDTDGTLAADSDLLVPSQKAVKTYVDAEIAGVTAVSDASTTTKGIAKLSVAPVSPTDPIAVGDNDPRNSDSRTPTTHASTHTNGTDDIQTANGSQKGLLSSADWTTFNNKQASLGYTPEDVANKQTDLTASATKYPTVNAVNTGLSGKLDNTDAAVGARINAASAATPLDTDLVATAASAGSLLNITWTNIKAFFKTYFDTLYQAILVSGTNIKTINGSSILGSGNLTLSGTGDVVGPASSVASEIALFDGITGKLLKRATGTGVAKVTSGVLSAANVVESEITLADNTTNNASTSNHGFLKKLSNVSTEYMNGQGNWAAVSGGSGVYTLPASALSSSPNDSQTAYFGSLARVPTVAAGISKMYIPVSGTLVSADIYTYAGGAGTAESWSFYVRLNNTTDYLIDTIATATQERRFSNYSLSIAVVQGDYVEIKMVNPLWATNPTSLLCGGHITIQL